MIVWLLMIVFLGPAIFTQQELHRYDTIQECQVERDRIGYLMAAEYPWDHDFNVVCQFQAAATNLRRT